MKSLLTIILLLPGVLRAQTGTQTGTLTGAVRDARHSAVPFASVAVAGTGVGVTADAAGRFSLPGVPAGRVRVQLSAVGYTTAVRDTALAEGQTLSLQLVLATAPAALTEVVVTGVSRATEIRRSPVPIATLGRREINLNANTNVIDAAVRGIPGLSAVTTGPNVSKPFIRGLGYNRVLTLYNGLRQEGQQWGDEHGVEIDGYDIERVEVVKGPASLLYGSDAVAGVVNLLPALPSGPEGRLGGEALTEFHSNNGLLGTSLGLNYQKNGFQTSFRASRRLAHDYRNAVDGLVYNTGFRELTLTGMAGVNKAWGHSHWYLTLYDNQQEIPDGSRDSLSRRFTRQVAESARDDIKNRPLVSENTLRSYAIAPLHQRIRHHRIFTRTQVRLGGGELHLLLGAQQNRRREFNHPTAPAQPGLALNLTTYTYDLRYHLPAWQGLEISVGSNGMGQLNRHRAATDFPIPNYNLLDAGTFLLLKKPVGPKLELSGGVRYDTRRVSWDDFYVAPNPATGFDAAAGPRTAGAQLQFPAFRRRYQGVSASLGASYVATEHLTLRANLARGYRAPNIPEIGSNGLDPGAHIVYLGNRGFQPEFSWQQDVGVLWHQPTLDASVEVFHNYVQNFIYQARLLDAAGQPVVIVPGNTTYQFQQAAARLYGLEASLSLRPAALPWLALSSSLALVNGRNEDAALRASEGAAARYLPLIPPLRGRAEARATLPARPGRLTGTYFRASLDGSARQGRFYALDNTETATPGYALLGLGAGTTLRSRAGREAVQLFVQVDNVLDRAYQAHLNRLKYFEYYQASPDGRSGIYNPGRNVSLKVVVPF